MSLARTETHVHHFKDLDDPVLASILGKTYGLNCDSILNSLHQCCLTKTKCIFLVWHEPLTILTKSKIDASLVR